MASVRNRGNKWQARMTHKGFPNEVKSFTTRQDAERWARSVETEMDKGCFINRSAAESTMFKVIIKRYIADVCPTMRGGADESIRLRMTCRTKLSMALLTPKAIADYRDERLKQVKPGTVIRELAYLSSIINHARREWDINITNPVASVRKPSPPQG